MIHHGVEIEQDFVIVQLAAIIAARQRLAIAREARKEIRHDRDVTGVDEFLSQVRRVLHDAVALVQMNDHRFLARAAEDAEMSVYSVIYFDGCEHG
jgi:hypothetical protein